MSATTRNNRKLADRLGRQHDLESKAEKIRGDFQLTLGDIFDDHNVGLGLIRTALAPYGIEFLARLADLRAISELEPVTESFEDKPNTVWEDCRRKAAAAILLYLREQANQHSVFGVGEGNPQWIFLGYDSRDPKILPLSAEQLEHPHEFDSIVEHWAHRTCGYVQVWCANDAVKAKLAFQAASNASSDNRYVIEARRRFATWIAQEAAA